ncbi:MAG: ATP-binding protein [Gammaproteobacteria bacterium]
MDIRFQPNNTHLDSGSDFSKTDPHLKRLYAEKLVYRSDLIDQLPWEEPCILTLTGGRQIGKTTLLKQWMENLLKKGVGPKAICFFSGELITDYQSLYTVILAQIENMPKDVLKYCIIDEVTYINDWDKTVKYLADTGALDRVVLVLSGSDSVLIQDARKRFPGRRGNVDQADFHYYPLSFREFIELKKVVDIGTIGDSPNDLDILFKEFDSYLVHGGFLKAINDFEKNNRISLSTLTVYADWIRGDVLKRNKKEVFLREIIGAIIKHYMKQVSWDNLVKELSIDHTQTVADYMEMLNAMDAVFVQSAIREDTLSPAPKKRKKIMFSDPFIYHAMRAWIRSEKNPYESQIITGVNDPEICSDLVEACVASHFKRYYSTYYIKAEGEVDIAYVKNNHFYPIEVKWTSQLRPKDLKQISKYSHGEIYANVRQATSVNHIPVKPLPLALLALF